MKLYTNAKSRGNTLLPFLKELDIEDQIEIIERPYEHMHQADYLAINPMGKVPCLVDQDCVISETPAIFAYLADKYIDKGFAPALDDPKRGEYLKWLFFCHGPLTELMDIKSLQVDPDILAQQQRSLSCGSEKLVLDFIQHGLAQAKPYLLGSKISAADLYLGYWLAFAISFKLVPYLDEFKPFLQLIGQRASMQGVTWFVK